MVFLALFFTSQLSLVFRYQFQSHSVALIDAESSNALPATATAASESSFSPIMSEQMRYYIDRYNYIAPSTRGKKHAACTKSNNTGVWEWFQLDKRERSRGLEDFAIYEWFFKDLEHGKGTYVELGAFTGTDESNSRFFDECLGWDGLLIEGNPSVRASILQDRPFAHKIFFAPSCSDEKANDTIQFHAQPFSHVGQQGVVKAFAGDSNKMADVPCGPLTPVLQEILHGHVNFFSLDVEGAEALVLKTIDWTKVQIDVLIVESINKHCKTYCKTRREVRAILKRAGYKLYIDGIYRSDLFVHPSLQKVPPAQFVEGYANRPQKEFFKAEGVRFEG